MEKLITESLIEQKRIDIDQALTVGKNALIAVIGPCAPDVSGVEQLINEAAELDNALGDTRSDIVLINRLPIWKPRSDPASWAGIDTSDPEAAQKLIEVVSSRYGMTAIEVGKIEHISNYISKIAFAWIGARNIDNSELLLKLAVSEPSLPIGVKNGLDGNLNHALQAINKVQSERGTNASPMTLIFRGGTNAQNPETWENAYKQAYDATEGNLLVDVAHGGEMAHSPMQDFSKSVDGQIECFDHVIKLAQEGLKPAGILCEASNTHSQVDPVIPLEAAITRTQQLARI